MRKGLVLGIFTAAAVVAAIGSISIPAAAGDRFVDQTQAVKPDGVVQISNVAGSIRVVSWAKPEVHVAGELEEKVKRVDFEVRDGRTNIRVVIPEHPHGDAAAYLTVSVPAESKIDINAVSASVTIEDGAAPELERPMREFVYARSVSGEVEVAAWASSVELKSISGEVSFSGVAETIDIETVSGNIVCSGAHSADLQTVSGEISVSNADSVKSHSTSGDLTATNIGRDAEASSISGDMEMTVASMGKVSAQTVSGDVELDGALAPAGRVTASTQSGEVEVSFPPEVSAEFDIHTMSGEFETDFGIKSQGHNRNLNFSLGNGDGYVRISTTSGDITINKL